MKSILLYGFVATVLFAASATVSLYYLPGKSVNPHESTKPTSPKTAETASKAEEADQAGKLRPLVKSSLPETEQTALLLQTLRDREKAVREKEDQFAQRRKQMELVYQDIRGERGVLDDVRKEISEELREVTKKLADLDKRAGDLDKQKQSISKDVTDLQQRQVDLESNERKNIDKLAKVYESMAPESAARIIQQMADTSRLDTAVKILSLMKERQAALILDQIPDAALVAQLTEKLRSVKKTPAGGIVPTSSPGQP